MFFSLPLATEKSRARPFSVRLTRLRCTVPPKSGQLRASFFLASSAASAEGRTSGDFFWQANTPRTTAKTAPVPATASQRRRAGVEVMGWVPCRRRMNVVPRRARRREPREGSTPGAGATRLASGASLIRRDLHAAVVDLGAGRPGVDDALGEAVQQRAPLLVRSGVHDADA